VSALDWVASVAVDVEGGQAWREKGELFDDLYAGTAGVLLGCAEAAAAGLEVDRLAAGAASRLRHLVEHPSATTLADDGLFTGWAGVAVALRAWSSVSGDDEAGAAATLLAATLAERCLAIPRDPAGCTDIISGDAGVLLALLPDQPLAAGQLADRLVSVVESGPQWRMTHDWPFLMPGFSHGTAGVAYALAQAGHQLQRPDLLGLAIQAAEHLLELGQTADGWALPLAIPARPTGPTVNYGWCHGPAGTARLFLALQEIDPRDQWQQGIEGCLQALRDSGIPERKHPGFWDNLGRCCGSAGVGMLLLDGFAATGDVGLLDFADVLAADVMSRALQLPGGMAWSNTEHKEEQPELPPEPGLLQGAIGIASWLARLEAVRAGRLVPALLPC
jgi:lantibiotic modifying enzyme